MIELPQGDTVIDTRRKHWFTLFKTLLPLAIISPLPLIIYALCLSRDILTASPVSSIFITFISTIWLLVLWMRAAHIFTDYYLDVWALTDKHLVGMDQRTLFHRHTAIVRIERIQDIAVEVAGFIETFFEYGDLHVQSAGESREFIMRDVSHPHTFREQILREQDRLLKRVKDGATGIDPDLPEKSDASKLP